MTLVGSKLPFVHVFYSNSKAEACFVWRFKVQLYRYGFTNQRHVRKLSGNVFIFSDKTESIIVIMIAKPLDNVVVGFGIFVLL